MSMQFWKHYERVTAIAECSDLNQVRPLDLNNCGIFAPQALPLPVLQYTTEEGLALVVTRHEGYATQVDDGVNPPQQVFEPLPPTGSGIASVPQFRWVYTPSGGSETIVMPSQPQSVFDADVILPFPANSQVVLDMTYAAGNAVSFDYSFRAYAWLIPQAAYVNFTQIRTLFGGAF